MENRELAEDECICNFVIYKDSESMTSQGRVSVLVEVFKDGEKIDFGYSPSRIDDNNNFLKFKLKKNTAYKFYLSDGNNLERTPGVTLITGSDSEQEHTMVIEK
jgi:hypothetical protein